jgi:CheY-like chemotaxis protein
MISGKESYDAFLETQREGQSRVVLGETNMFKILIVEDSASFRELLRGALETHFPKMAFEEATDGNQALQKVDSFLPDLIFMDIRLPGENGLELTKKIKKDRPGTIIVILTSYDLPEYREAAFNYGANDFLVKSVSSEEEIVNLVESLSKQAN